MQKIARSNSTKHFLCRNTIFNILILVSCWFMKNSFLKKAVFCFAIFIQGKKWLTPFPVMSAKTKRKIIIENRDNKIIHERREETVESSFFGFMGDSLAILCTNSHLVCRSKLNCKLSQKRQALASGSRSK